MNRTELLNLLINRYQYASYLELGVDKGENFIGVKLVDKVGVDISRNATYRMSTDDFFRICDRKFDLVFIDADHEAEQAYRDFENSLWHLNDNGCIVFHDCLPQVEIHQSRRRRSNQWTGNVWKAFIRVRQRADVNAFVVDADWGLGIVFKQPNTDQLPRIRPLDWETFVNRGAELLRIIQPEQLLDILPVMK
jgi:hypothetical protein